MSTPVNELPEPTYPDPIEGPSGQHPGRCSDEETYIGQGAHSLSQPDLERMRTEKSNNTLRQTGSNIHSPSRAREEAHRRGDDLELEKAERVASRTAEQSADDLYRTRTVRDLSTTGSRRIDEFDISVNPVHQSRKAWRPPTEPASKVAKFVKKVGGGNIQARFRLLTRYL